MGDLSVSTGDLAQRTWHRVLVAGLATAAICFAILGWVGYWVPIYQHVEFSDRFHAYFYTSEGLARFYWLRADDGFYLDTPDNFVRVTVRRRRDNSEWHSYYHARPNAIDSMAVLGWRNLQRQRQRAQAVAALEGGAGGPISFVRLYGVRTWISLPIALVAAYPIFVLTRASRRRYLLKRRRKAGQCEQCGYDLTGLTESRCPECGYSSHLGATGGLSARADPGSELPVARVGRN